MSILRKSSAAASPDHRLKNHAPSPPFGVLTVRRSERPPPLVENGIVHLDDLFLFWCPRRPHADGRGVCASRLDYQTLPLRLCADGHSVPGHNGQFSASIVILSEDLRYAQIIRERPGLWSREAVMSRHASAVPWITASASAQALGIYALPA